MSSAVSTANSTSASLARVAQIAQTATPRHSPQNWTKAALAERLRSKLNDHVASNGGVSIATPRDRSSTVSVPGLPMPTPSPHAATRQADAAPQPAGGRAGQRTPRVLCRSDLPLEERLADEACRCLGLSEAQRQTPVAGADDVHAYESRGRGRAPSAPPDYTTRLISAPEFGVSHSLSPRGTVAALEGDTLRMERLRLLQAQDKQQKWLEKALTAKINEVNRELETLAKANAQDAHAEDVARRHEEEMFMALQVKREARELRESVVFENNLNLERQRRFEADEYLRKEQHREERLAALRAQRLDELREHASAEAARHDGVFNEGVRLQKERRDVVAEHVQAKDEKVTTLLRERQRLWKMRRDLVWESAQAWETLKDQIENRSRSSEPQDLRVRHSRQQVSPRI